MKTWLALLTTLTVSASGLADEIKMRGAAWDDLSTALNITPFYLEIQSSTTTRKVTLILEIFRDGKAVKPVRSNGFLSQKAEPISLKSSLFFSPKDNPSEYAVTWVVTSSSGGGPTRFTVPNSVIGFSNMTFRAAKPSMATSTKSLVATIICNAPEQRFSIDSTASLEAIIEANKGATVIGIFLERE